jgi:translation initiation factor IF-2
MRVKRPPVVTVLGHVDHGKTTLLDAIKKTNIAAREAGGITQSIGASKISTPEGEITFIDTPGHAAFSQMRARGARVADIAVLVVAAADGVMPQTKEALTYIKENKLPMIVAFTKTDLPSANVERARGQLEEEEVLFEGRGGATPSAEISVKLGRGVEELVELILLFAEVTGFTADPDGPLSALVIETNKGKRGILVSAVVKDGKLKVGDEISASGLSAKVRGLFNEYDKPVREAMPSDPVLILGFSGLPAVGSEIGASKGTEEPRLEGSRKVGKLKLQEGQIPLILKVQSAGAIEAVVSTLPKPVVVLSSAVGEVTESDVFFAKTSGATIIVFEAGVPGTVRRLAENEGVEIASFKVIYEIAEYLGKRISESEAPILGRAQILAEFPFDKSRVAGLKVTEGRIQKTDKLILLRGEGKLGEAKIVSMRRGKNELSVAKAGEECGVVLSPLLAFAKGDILVATN